MDKSIVYLPFSPSCANLSGLGARRCEFGAAGWFAIGLLSLLVRGVLMVGSVGIGIVVTLIRELVLSV